MACHFDFLVEYVSPNDDSIRAAGTFEMSQISNDGLSVDSRLCSLHTTGLGTICHNRRHLSGCCRSKLSRLGDNTLNTVGIAATSHAVHHNRANCQLSFIGLISTLCLYEWLPEASLHHRLLQQLPSSSFSWPSLPLLFWQLPLPLSLRWS